MQATAESPTTGRRRPGTRGGMRALENEHGPSTNGTGRPPPHDEAAERALIGAMLVPAAGWSAIEAAAAAVAPDDFYTPAHRNVVAAIFALAAKSTTVDVVTVADQLRKQGLWVDEMATDLVAMMTETPSIGGSAGWAAIVAGCARRRRFRSVAATMDHAAQEGDEDLLSRALEEAHEVAAAGRQDLVVEDLDDFLMASDDEYDWVVPDLIERGDRVILTASEGRGKSMLLRQIGVTVASGLHPFTLEPIKPARVLIVDLENPDGLVRRSLRPLRIKAGPALLQGSMGVVTRPEGLNLLDPVEAAGLDRAVGRWQPDLLCIGPLYKLALGDPIVEEVARSVAFCLDGIRARHHCAVILEAHSPHPTGKEARPERPYGASLWLRWPEIGLHLGEGDHLRHWRGDRDVRSWPAALARGGQWPFRPAEAPAPPPAPVSCAAAIQEILAAQRGTLVGRNELVNAVRATGHHYRDSVIADTAESLAISGLVGVKSGPRRSRLYFAPLDTQEEF